MKWDRFFEGANSPGLCLLFFPNVPGATFIQGATLIPESRVCQKTNKRGCVLDFYNDTKLQTF